MSCKIDEMSEIRYNWFRRVKFVEALDDELFGEEFETA